MTTSRRTRALALSAGAVAACLLLAAGRLPDQHPGLDLRVSANRTGALDVVRPGAVLDVAGLGPTAALPPAEVGVTNITGQDLRVTAATSGGGSAAEPGLRAVLTAGGSVVYRGPLVGLAGGSEPFRIESGETADVVLQLAPSGAENPPGIVDLDLDFSEASPQTASTVPTAQVA